MIISCTFKMETIWKKLEEADILKEEEGEEEKEEVDEEEKYSPGNIISMGEVENSAILYFFHGAGCTSYGLKEWLRKICQKEFLFPHIKVIFPSAPCQNYQLNLNRDTSVWFDREALTESSNEINDSVNEICNKMLLCIEKEGIPYDKIIVGGFSMGGALALHLAYRFNKPFAGCFAISSFLNHDSQVYQSLEGSCESQKPPLLLLHGRNDSLIPWEWSKKLKENLEDKGINITSRLFLYTDHEIVKEEVKLLKEWILERLPTGPHLKPEKDQEVVEEFPVKELSVEEKKRMLIKFVMRK